MPPIKGIWQNLTCELGHTHRVYIQKKSDECAIACAAMAIQRLTGQELDLAKLRSESQKGAGGYRPGVKDAGAFTDEDTAWQRHDLAMAIKKHLRGGYTGTKVSSNLPALLKTFGVLSRSYNQTDGTQIRNNLKRTSRQRPFIINIRWTKGGGHAVFVDRHNGHYFKKDQFCICDPYDGMHVETLVPDTSFRADAAQWETAIPYRGGKGHIRVDYLELWKRPAPPPARRRP